MVDQAGELLSAAALEAMMVQDAADKAAEQDRRQLMGARIHSPVFWCGQRLSDKDVVHIESLRTSTLEQIGLGLSEHPDATVEDMATDPWGRHMFALHCKSSETEKTVAPPLASFLQYMKVLRVTRPPDVHKRDLNGTEVDPSECKPAATAGQTPNAEPDREAKAHRCVRAGFEGLPVEAVSISRAPSAASVPASDMAGQ